MKLTKKKIGTILMIAGFIYALVILFFFPEQRETAMYGFALIGFGCVLGIRSAPKNAPPAQKKPGSGIAGKKRRK